MSYTLYYMHSEPYANNGYSFARANTATHETHLLVVGGGASDNLDTCENLISKNIYKVNDWFVF